MEKIMHTRRISRSVSVGNLQIGGNAPITVQSMTNIPASDFDAILRQTQELVKAGCDIVRLSIPDEMSASVFPYLRKNEIRIPLVADIHFDYRLALSAVRNGASKIRINPGNIGASWKVREVAEACLAAGVPIRIGVNGGSLDPELRKKYGKPLPQALAESALEQAEMLEKCGFSQIVLSMKTSSLYDTLETYRLVAAQCDYPLHVGVTEAGDAYTGLIKNAVGIGALLAEGIGDTLRISLTAPPQEEVRAGRELLKTLHLDVRGGVEVISCPTCGRTGIPLISLAEQYKQEIASLDTRGKRIKVAIMGCVVNGPGEARDADFGIAGGDGFAVFFQNGTVIRRVEEKEIIPLLIQETQALIPQTPVVGDQDSECT